MYASNFSFALPEYRTPLLPLVSIVGVAAAVVAVAAISAFVYKKSKSLSHHAACTGNAQVTIFKWMKMHY